MFLVLNTTSATLRCSLGNALNANYEEMPNGIADADASYLEAGS